MDTVTTLVSQYSSADIIVFLILILAAIKAIDELFSYFWNKIKTYFTKEQIEEDEHQALISRLDIINNKVEQVNSDIEAIGERLSTSEKMISTLDQKVHILTENIQNLNEQSKRTDQVLTVVQERLQNQSRDRLIELHHKYVYEFEMIDDYGLQSMERTYLDYKACGGNTFIDTLMDEVRALPRPAFEKEGFLNAITVK